MRSSNLRVVCDVDIDFTGGSQWTSFCQCAREHLEERPL